MWSVMRRVGRAAPRGVVVVVVAMTATLGIPVSAAAPAPVEAPPAPSPPAEPPPADPAPGEELEGERTGDTKTFATDEPGVYRTEVYADPVHYREPGGDWEEIDPELVETDDGFASTGTPAPVSIAAGEEADETRVEVDLGDGRSAGFALPSAAVEQGRDGAVVVEDVASGTDARLEVATEGVKETLVLADRDTDRDLAFTLELDGVEPVAEPGGALALVDGAGEVAGRIPAPWMEDSTVHPVTGESVTSFAVRYVVTPLGAGRYRLALDLDDAWLDDPARTYPVLVDPSILQADGHVDDTFVMAYSAGDRSALSYLQVGNNGFLGTRAFIHFPGLSALSGKNVHVAALKLYQDGAGSCTPSPLDVYRVATSWVGSTTMTWGGPAPDGPRIASSSDARGASGCAAGWVQVEVTNAVASWADGSVPNHGFTLRARDEFATTNFKRFAASSTWVPPHVQVIWSETTAASPAVPTDIRPDELVGTLTPRFSSVFADPQRGQGANAYAVFDGEDQLAGGGAGTQVGHGGRSEWVPAPGVLQPGTSYVVEAYGGDLGGATSASSDPVAFSTSILAFSDLRPGTTVFADESFAMTTSSTAAIARVELLVDEELVGSDSSPPYVVPWDTTTVADGEHSLRPRLVLASEDVIDGGSVPVQVGNDEPASARLEIDLRQGRITKDQFSLQGVQAVLGVPGPSARYTAAEEDPRSGTTDVISFVTRHWDDLQTGTQEDIAELLDPPQPSSFAPPDALTAAEEDFDACDTQLHRRINGRLATYCRHVHDPSGSPLPPIEVYFTVGEGASDIDPQDGVDANDDDDYDDPSDVPPNAVPDQVEVAVENMQIAGEHYIDMGFELPGELDDDVITVVFDDQRSFANPAGSILAASHAVTLDSRDEPVAVARHEMFHLFQYAYVSLRDLGSTGLGFCEVLCRDTGLWVLEATAEWADHQVVEAENLGSGDEDDAYASDLPEFALNFDEELTHHSFEDDRAYGAFIFFEYMEERFGSGVVLDVFEVLDENGFFSEHTGIEAVEEVLNDEEVSTEAFLQDFWRAAYLLTGMDQALAFEDDDVSMWRQKLVAAANGSDEDYDPLEGDAFDGTPRPRRSDYYFALQDDVPQLVSYSVGRGGVDIYDIERYDVPETLTALAELGGTVEIEFEVDPDRDEKVAFGVVRYTDDGYPEICPSAAPVFPDEDGEGELSFRIDDTCPGASLFVFQVDPNTGYGPADFYSFEITFHEDEG